MSLNTRALGLRWVPARPRVLVVACSDGRLQEATDAFLARDLGVRQYDRLYVPGGGGALSSGRGEFLRSYELRRECRFLVEAHQVEQLVLLFHGPADDGPAEAICADYRRHQPWAPVHQVRAQQDNDVHDLLWRRDDFAGGVHLFIYRLEVTPAGGLSVATLHEDASARTVEAGPPEDPLRIRTAGQ
jgi:hypothetical protein